MNYTTLYSIKKTNDWSLTRVQHPTTQARYTLKQLSPAAQNPDRTIQLLKNEFHFLRQIEHAHILKPLQLDPDRGSWILYEDAQCTLAKLSEQEGVLPVDLIANVMQQVAEALKALNEKKFGHGSLDSRSVLVGTGGEAKLAGFTGHSFVGQTEPLTLDDSAKYRAPELLRMGTQACNETSDLYCLGYLALELLTADKFEDMFIMEERDRQAGGVNWLAWHVDPMRKLPELQVAVPNIVASLREILSALIVKEPVSRGYRSASHLLKALADFRLNSQRRLPAFYAPQLAAVKPQRLPRPRPKLPPSDTAASGKVGVLKMNITEQGEEYPVEFFGPNPVLIGKAAGCACRIVDDSMSAKHALLTCQKDGWWIYDLGSTGIFRDSQRLLALKLRPDVILQCGNSQLHIQSATIPQRKGGVKAKKTTKEGETKYYGRFQLMKRIHQGNQGDLYKATIRQGEVNRLVALRVYPKHFASDALQLRRFLRGNPAAAQLKHPNIVRLIRGGSVKHEGGKRSWYLAMEYLSGGSLRDRIQKGILSEKEVVQFGLDIAHALMAAEEHKLLHRNINPSCILFSQSGVAKLGDFALLRQEELQSMYDITKSGSAPLGEYVYQPPEIIQGASPTMQGDLYSLAACMYQALTGKPPVRLITESYPEQLSAIRQDIVAPITDTRYDVSPRLNTLILRTLAKSPSIRTKTLREFINELTACQSV